MFNESKLISFKDIKKKSVEWVKKHGDEPVIYYQFRHPHLLLAYTYLEDNTNDIVKSFIDRNPLKGFVNAQVGVYPIHESKRRYMPLLRQDKRKVNITI